MRTAWLLPLIARQASAACEAWCSEPCHALNGDVTTECNDCDREDPSISCFEGAEGYSGWQAKAQQFHQMRVSADGEVTRAPDPDAPIEHTSNSVIYATPYYEIANKHRDSELRLIGAAAALNAFEEPLPIPQETPRHCEVHSCVLIEGDDACARGLAGCTGPRGHLRPIGEQFETIHWAAEYNVNTSGPLSAPAFWQLALAKVRPLVLRGGAAAATDLALWTDDALRQACELEGGQPWHVLVEKQNRITQNDRHPLMPNWNFCQFLDEYVKPQYTNMLYCVNAITARGLRLREHISLPEVFACDDLYHALYDARLWMSQGNTTSSLHFDTHENLLLQLDGEKEVFLWHPNETANFYMDFHPKFGLSPINMDRVDLERFPSLANATTFYTRLQPGDAVYIPDSWWHVIRSHRRNVAIALEVAPFAGEQGLWPPDVRQRREAPGLYWAEQTRINAAMHEKLLAEGIIRSRTSRQIARCDTPLGMESRPLLSEIEWLGVEPKY